jgi:hypothetical protein
MSATPTRVVDLGSNQDRKRIVGVSCRMADRIVAAINAGLSLWRCLMDGRRFEPTFGVLGADAPPNGCKALRIGSRYRLLSDGGFAPYRSRRHLAAPESEHNSDFVHCGRATPPNR